MAADAPWARLEPPEGLTEDASALWREVVLTKPSEWFKADTAPLLEAYCKTVCEYRRAVRVLDSTDPTDARTYKILVDVAMKLSGQMANLATKMRLTPQSRYTPQAAATANRKVASTAKPWEQ